MAQGKRHEPKLPAKQLAILAVVRFAEPLALTSVFPYLPEMIQGFGVEKDDVAQWAGITGAVFSICQSVTAVPWGWASDSMGRKPTILIGLVCTMICFVFWGVSTSLPMAIAVRAIQGASNGNVGTIRTMVAEMVPEKILQPRAFSIMPLVWSIGSVFGPSFGGFFAKPAEQFPSLFGSSEFLKKYPFALPNIVACVFFFISVFTAMLFLKETLESKRHEKDWGLRIGEKLTRSLRPAPPKSRQHRHSFVDGEATAPLLSQAERANNHTGLSTPSSEIGSTAGLFTYQTVMALICYTFLALHSVAYDQVLPVFLNYPRQIPDEHNTQLPFKFSGGFGLGSDKIGTIFTVYGVACGLIQFLVFPPMCAHFGVMKCYRFASVVFPFVYLVTPYTTLVQDERLRYVVFLAILLVKGFVVIIGFPCMTIMLTNSAPSLKVLGTLNGFATTFSGLGRAIGPAATGAAFTWGVQRGYIITGWWLLAAISAIGAIPPFFLEESDGPAAHNADALSDDDDDDADADADAADADESVLVFADDDDDERISRGRATAVRDDDAQRRRKMLNVVEVNRRQLTPSPLPSDDEVMPSLRPGRRRDYGSTSPVPFVRLRRMSTTASKDTGEDLRDKE